MTQATTTLNVRNIDAQAARQIVVAARSRRLHVGAYLARLADLHVAMRALANGGDHQVAAELERLGLQTVQT